ncbi:MAG: HAD-IIIC family phosphatase, partial [Campylobacterota bacterium]|nr:HAD-IIIC family phosphatase [Campylobacterota bacterium]
LYKNDSVSTKSFLYKSDSEIIILFLDINELNENIDDVISAVDKFIVQTNKTVILNTVCYTPIYIDTFLNKSLENELNINLKLLSFSRKNSNVLLLDFLKLIKQNNFIDEKYWYMARIKYSKFGFELISREIINIIKTYKYGSKKVLVLDMDNTLWGGIIGEDEIKLSNDGVGKIYLDFQKNIKKLHELGILLAVCSKNNYDDGIRGLNHSNSILKEDDFIIKKINWNDKASNIKEILEELNLGDNSLVFIDDNPVEREYVKNILPNVSVPEFPNNIYSLNSWFLNIVEDYFSKISLTKEDLKKQEQYIAKIKRDNFSRDISYDDFLKSLNIEIEFLVNDNLNIERYAQMTQKTNQFNLTTKRYTTSDIKSFIDNDNYNVIAINYKDKFANEGITGLIILHDKKDFIEIDTLLLSCRILKRGVEKAIFKKIDELYLSRDIIGNYIPSSKNIQTKELYSNYGFVEINNNKFIKKGN